MGTTGYPWQSTLGRETGYGWGGFPLRDIRGNSIGYDTWRFEVSGTFSITGNRILFLHEDGELAGTAYFRYGTSYIEIGYFILYDTDDIVGLFGDGGY